MPVCHRKNSIKCTVCGWDNHIANDCAYKNCNWHKCDVKGHLATECKKVSHKYLSDLDVDNEVDTDQSVFNLSDLNKPVA